MDDVIILEVLQKATTAAVAASTLGADFPVKYLGRTFTPPNDQKWLEVVFIPNNIEGGYWGTEKDYRGIYRLILHWPNDDAGFYTPMRALSSICSYFQKDKLLSGVQIYEGFDSMTPIEAGSETLYPASARYTNYRPGA